nr:variable large family protein [Borreliella turdi]
MAKDGKFAVKSAEKGSEKAGDGNIGTVVNADAADAVKADAENVKAIAKGIKAIVDAAVDGGKGSVKLDAQAASGTTNKDAGKLFGKKTADDGAKVEDANKAAAAVNAVSGMQILKVIVDDAEKGTNGAKADNIVDAAIGNVDGDAVHEFGAGGMNKDDKIAAAIVLRGMAKDGKFAVKSAEKGAGEAGGDNIGTVVNANAAVKADAENVKAIAKGIKAIVDAAVDGGKGSVKLDAQAASGTTNADAGKLFGKKNDGNGAEVADANKAAAAVNAVSGMQILKVIVDDAEKGNTGKAANAAKNIVDAAIGDDANAVGAGGMNKDDKIAAAIVLRGMAKDGKFAVKNTENWNGC